MPGYRFVTRKSQWLQSTGSSSGVTLSNVKKVRKAAKIPGKTNWKKRPPDTSIWMAASR